MTRKLTEVELAPDLWADIDDDGSGAWVFLLHSRFANKRLWSRVAANIPYGSLCAFNQRGFNEGDRTPPSPEQSLASLRAVFDVLRPRRTVLVGTSTGAGVALAACTDPGLPIIGAVLAGFLVPSWDNAPAARGGFERGTLIERTFTRRFVAERPGDVARFDEIARQVEHAARAFSIDDFWKFLVKFPYHAIRIPLLFVTGSEDDVLPPHIVRESLRRLPTARSILLPDVAHGVIGQAPDQFTAHLVEFLATIRFGDDPPRD